MDVAILLDGDFTRRMLRRKLKHNPSPSEVEAFCISTVRNDETIFKVYYYDCPPFSKKRESLISKNPVDFSKSRIFQAATTFQENIMKNKFFIYRRGHLSFGGWAAKDSFIQDIMSNPRRPTDEDFKPILTQKQVDMKIGFDVAKLSINQKVHRILLATSDADFIPAIHFAKTFGLEVVLLTDIHAIGRTKGVLLKAFSDHRII